MIGISKLYCGTVEPSDALRYGRDSGKLPSHLLQFSKDKKPVVVWNVGQRCNLKCVHCYSQSKDIEYTNELNTKEAKAMIDGLAEYGAPVLLFSGGEPLMREDLMELIAYAKDKGLRAVISTNGTMITEEKGEELKKFGLSYVGISLDGLKETNDKFRGIEGAFDDALQGIRNCLKLGIKVGLRFTINKRNAQDIPGIFDLIEKEGIPRVCFYHLVYSGRGSRLVEEDLTHEETRKVVDLIIDKTKEAHDRGNQLEVLTVDNHADGPYIYQRLLKEDPKRAAEVLELLKWNEGNSSGHGLACVSWDGAVHPDQFWREHTFGNVRERKFGEIWEDKSNDLLMKLKEKKDYVTGRCSKCKWLDICGGNFRARAESVHGDIWEPDPACYLTDEEIGLLADVPLAVK
ncbi:MAG: 12,18-didecarboxysiroheme deacetylase [Candidatus Scalindua rubra]|uniref:Pre-heme d1 synthase n=1 Tax=Candidatus Scalindua brodae TaxID=237368 RepID=A0A0B0EMH6_9BACT|nr:MAG: moaA/nirJ/pqqE cofactor biosynthesis protein [Candidatus Scalindua brodae]MBZ0107928.1 12,18-didecarboxysiroheme deacetylase [Candidatus Scalindua rubra]TWU31044.1 Antilisterial bacteriocin subtilosin biosynthesis protein AlbA [Candidatus Brocadiaceae bacterium S225]